MNLKFRDINFLFLNECKETKLLHVYEHTHVRIDWKTDLNTYSPDLF